MYYKNERSELNFVGLMATSFAVTTGFMLVDLSDVINWPHTNTGHIELDFVNINFNPDDNFNGSVAIGYLANVDAANGDLFEINRWVFEQGVDDIGAVYADSLNFGGKDAYFHCGAEHYFGYTNLGDVLFQTDVNLMGPNGNVAFPSGNGDLVMKITRTAGTISVGVSLGYTTHK